MLYSGDAGTGVLSLLAASSGSLTALRDRQLSTVDSTGRQQRRWLFGSAALEVDFERIKNDLWLLRNGSELPISGSRETLAACLIGEKLMESQSNILIF